MFSVVKSMSLEGIEGYLVEVQTDIAGGLPSFNVVGLPDVSIKESKERVRSAIKNTGFEIPSRRILVNLAPADKRKEGTCFDLPIAIGILITAGIIHEQSFDGFNQTIFLGELSLDGKVNRVKGVLPMCIDAKNLGIKRVIVPTANAREAGVIEELEVIPVKDLNEVVNYINGDLDIKRKIVDINKILNNKYEYNVDFSEVKGQKNVKRALEISVAGGHNCILIGSPRIRKKHVITKSFYNFTRFNL